MAKYQEGGTVQVPVQVSLRRTIDRFFNDFPCCADCLVQAMCVKWHEWNDFNNTDNRRQGIKHIEIYKPCVDFFNYDSKQKRERYRKWRENFEKNEKNINGTN